MGIAHGVTSKARSSLIRGCPSDMTSNFLYTYVVSNDI